MRSGSVKRILSLLILFVICGCKDGGVKPAPPPPVAGPALLIVTTEGTQAISDPAWAVLGGVYTDVMVWTDATQVFIPWDKFVAVKSQGELRFHIDTLKLRQWTWEWALSTSGKTTDKDLVVK